MTLRDALSVSRNVPAVKSLQTVQKDVGNKKIVEFVENLGIKLKNNVAYESYAIGGLDEGVNTVQMAAAYAAFANGGYYTDPYTVKSITYRSNGKTEKFEAKRKQAMKDSTAYLITNILEYAAHYGFSGGTGSYSGTVAVKTGTSNYTEKVIQKYHLPSSAVNDLWSVAYTPQYSISLWYGYDEVSSQYYNVSSSYKDNLMSAIMKNIPVTKEGFKQPSSVVKSEVEYGSWPAQKPSEYTPSDLVKSEYFIKGAEPTATSNRFSKLDDVKNLKASNTSSGIKLTWDADTPQVISDDYLNKYFSQSVFGKSTATFVSERKAYNNSTLGGFGYGIYINGNEVAFTTDKTYTYKSPNAGNLNIVVKAEYRSFKNNASNGVSVKAVASGGSVTNEDDSSNDGLKITSGGSTSVILGDYHDSLNVKYNGNDVTSKCEISGSISGSSISQTFKSISELETLINAITTPGSYRVSYNIKYQGKTDNSTTKTINLNQS